MSKLFLVYGGESTGTRLMTKILIKGAGFYGDSGHEQRLDQIVNHHECQGLDIIVQRYEGVVWRRSFPHNRAWLNLRKEFSTVFPKYFKEVCVIVMTRNWLATARSQVKTKHVDNLGVALTNLQESYKYIFNFLEDYPWIRYHLVSFDMLVRQFWIYLPYLFTEFGIPKGRHDEEIITLMQEIHDSNEKHLWEVLSEQEEAKRTKKKD